MYGSEPIAIPEFRPYRYSLDPATAQAATG